MSSKPVWMLTLAIGLWGLNSLQLQGVQFEQMGTIAISQQRLVQLQALIRKSHRNAQYQFLDCKICSEETSPHNPSDMCTVKVRVRSSRFEHLERLEEYLLEKTRPQVESTECKVISQEIRQTQWQIDTMQHLQSGLERDRFRIRDLEEQKFAVDQPMSSDDSNLAAQNSDDEMESEPNSTQRRHSLVGFRKMVPSEDGSTESQEILEIQQVDDQLTHSCHDLQARVAALQDGYASAKESMIGYLSLTGVQRRYPVVQPISWNRAFVATLLCGCCWILVSLMVKRVPHSIKALIASVHRMRSESECSARSTTERKARDAKALPFISGIPFLGTIERVSERPAEMETHADEERKVAPESIRPRPICHWSPCHRGLEYWIQNLAAVALSAWVLLSIVRFLADNTWRDLFLASPIAGLTHIISGAP